MKTCDIFYLPPSWCVPAKLHSVQINHEKMTRIDRQFAVSITWLKQKMTQIEIAVIGTAIVHFTRYNGHLFDQPPLESNFTRVDRGMCFPLTAKFLQ